MADIAPSLRRTASVLLLVMAGLWTISSLAAAQSAQNRGDRIETTGSAGSLRVDNADRGTASPQENRDRPKKYQWLFRERSPEQAIVEAASTTLLDKLDKEIKQARKLYLAGETENAILRYRTAIDHFEAILEDVPPGNAILTEMTDRLQVYDELVTKILGPVNTEPREDMAGRVFHLLERKRICRRAITLKKAGALKFFDVPGTLVDSESDILSELSKVRGKPLDGTTRRSEESLKAKLLQVRQSLQKSSSRYAAFRRAVPATLDEVRQRLLAKDEMILDFNLLPDRMVVGIISAEKAIYLQFAAVRSDIDKAVFHFQDKLREYNAGDDATFMGHAWREPCRRLYRVLLGRLPALAKEKTTIFVVPDRSLWYLPFAAMLDAEDRPFGRDRLLSIIPSVEMLSLLRSSFHKETQSAPAGDLLLFESIPWVAAAQASEQGTAGKSKKRKRHEEEPVEQLILDNPVYPKPSEIVISLQKLFRKFDVRVGPTATLDRLLEYRTRFQETALMAVPLSMTDGIQADRQPVMFFSPDKQGNRRFDVARLLADPVRARMLVLPISWLEVQDGDNPLGEGPQLLSIAMFYSGTSVGLVNYSNPNWGSDEPFILSVLKQVAKKVSPGKALASYVREMTGTPDYSFSGKPPTWTGWILMGDPGGASADGQAHETGSPVQDDGK